MNPKDNSFNESDLHALVDGQLNTSERERLSGQLTADPETAKVVRDYQLINRELHRLYDDVAKEPIPSRLFLARPRHSNRWKRAAAMLGWLIIGTGIGWFAREWLTPPPTHFTVSLVQEAVSAHAVYTPEVRHPVEVDAEQEQHLMAWLSKRLNAEIRAPQLADIGFELLGGRLLPADNGPAAQFMYQDSRGQRLTLFVRKGDNRQQDTAFQFTENDGIRAFYWIDHNLGYALIGNINKPVLTRAAHLVYNQLSF